MSQENAEPPSGEQEEEGQPNATTPASSGTPTLQNTQELVPVQIAAPTESPTLMKRDSAMSGAGEAEQEDNVFDVQLSEVNKSHFKYRWTCFINEYLLESRITQLI